MKKKFGMIFLLIAAIFMLSACTEEPEVVEPEEAEESGYLEITTLPAEIDEEDLEGLDFGHDFTGYDIIVDGVGLADVNFRSIGEDEIFPTHVPLHEVALALGMGVSDWSAETDEITVESFHGPVHFFVHDTEFYVNGETVDLGAAVWAEDGIVYVPINFFTEVLGAGAAFFNGGHVFIATEGIDMR